MDQFQIPFHPGTGRRIYDLLRAQIADGTLAAGARAPSTRALAADLGVSRTTVTAAYEQLAAEGFLITAVGRAARVASPPAAVVPPPSAAGRRGKAALALSAFGRRLAGMDLPGLPHTEPARIDFLYGAVASRDFPALAWRRAYQGALLRHQHSLRYIPPEGDAALRRALQGYLRRARGLACDADQIVVVHGSQQGIDLCARLLLDAGDAFVFEEPGYLMARRCFEATGARLRAVPVDAHGLDTARLPGDGQVRLAYVTPSHQFPLGGVLPIGRRVELLQWAQRHRAWIVEDDYDGEFRYGQRPIDALQSIDTDGRVIYMGTFSKALSPQLRLGYLVLPTALVAVFRQAKRMADRHAPVLEQRTLASLIDSGAYERHVRRTRREHERRRAALADSVARYLPPSAELAGTAAGLHGVLWLPFIRPQDEAALAAAARAQGVGIYPVSPLFANAQRGRRARPGGWVLGYASLTVAQIDEGIQILAGVIAAWVAGAPAAAQRR
ncbi:MocR-like pyridoxine biosynthesis transcription factor PdxR [Acidovorax sp. NCPPB 3576]|uniref:MocR-like pyridoxine biosynthesis transcription factor PdxR n=1 Tax=Acidovorax sp. NCPPB 3576 TaxID=2940488 RepID=UPI00234A9481|nr:PLP-dependent aminotransferase family protein [Acidovorax sp. NCPPB 3576]WCM86562.1 PLP-dependent aminotransferase family protein [Acidovorax sp. NCPPB 3576]